MSPRDRAPYCEATDANNGDTLHALHNLTWSDLLLLLDALRSRRVIYAIRLHDVLGTPASIRSETADKADRIDLITEQLKRTLHATATDDQERHALRAIPACRRTF